MLNHSVITTSKSQVEINIWSKEGHIAHIWSPYINLKPNLCMKPNNTIYVIFSVLQPQIDHITEPENI